MARCLIVANQTLGGRALEASVRDCISREITGFYVVVPRTRVRDESTSWTGGFRVDDGMTLDQARAFREGLLRNYEAALDEERRRAQDRLDQMIEKIAAAGGQATGEVGVDDPLEATRWALGRQGPFDEIIVSTLPARISRWVRLDIPHRIARLTDVPVTTVEAAAEPG